MNQLGQQSLAESRSSAKVQDFIKDLWGVRYQVADVSRSIDFYTRQLGFQLEHKTLPAFAQVSVNFGWAILLTAGLSFVGAGVVPPTPEWGLMVSQGSQNIITGQWWPSLFPGLAIAVAVLGFALLGETLEHVLDPAQWR